MAKILVMDENWEIEYDLEAFDAEDIEEVLDELLDNEDEECSCEFEFEYEE